MSHHNILLLEWLLLFYNWNTFYDWSRASQSLISQDSLSAENLILIEFIKKILRQTWAEGKIGDWAGAGVEGIIIGPVLNSLVTFLQN